MSEKDGGQAFPAAEWEEMWDEEDAKYRPRLIHQSSGMSLRDYFAAQALVGIALQAARGYYSEERIAPDAYKLADAMLKERAK